MSLDNKKILISCGGTGGHIYPAIAVAKKIKEKYPSSEILFVGAKGKMEMKIVPENGFEIIGLPIMGLKRRFFVKNFRVFIKLILSLFKARKIINKFKPNVVFGTGGYASVPSVFYASLKGIPTVIHEQNNVVGLANKFLSRYVDKVCVSDASLLDFFDKKKVKLTGTPVRFSANSTSKEDALKFFNLKNNKKTLLVFGGSQGTKSVNSCIQKNLDLLINKGIQIIWITGEKYFEDIQKSVSKNILENIYLTSFLEKMEYAYGAADIVVARGGAATITEVCAAKLPAIFIPSPNVTDDQQKKNIAPLIKLNACIFVNDFTIEEQLITQILLLFGNENKRNNIIKIYTLICLTPFI